MPRQPRSSRLLLTASLLAATLSLAACGAKAPKQLPPEPGTGSTTTTMPTPAPTGPEPGSQADFLASVMSDTVNFDTDRYNIDAADQGILQSQAQWLARYPNKLSLIHI